MQNFCVVCHSVKVDTKTAKINIQELKVFSAMDQTKGAKEFPVDEVNITNKTKKLLNQNLIC